MTTDASAAPAAAPTTITMRWVQLSPGNFGVELLISGLPNVQKAEAAVAYMQGLLCGAEITSTH